MKYKVYYGSGIDVRKMLHLNEFDTIAEADKYVEDNIYKHHKNVYYIQRTFVSDDCRWYDYGHYTKFYVVKGE